MIDSRSIYFIEWYVKLEMRKQNSECITLGNGSRLQHLINSEAEESS